MCAEISFGIVLRNAAGRDTVERAGVRCGARHGGARWGTLRGATRWIALGYAAGRDTGETLGIAAGRDAGHMLERGVTPQEVPREPLRGPKRPQRLHRGPPRGHKTSQEGPQMETKIDKNRSKIDPRGVRGPQEVTRAFQNNFLIFFCSIFVDFGTIFGT